MAITEASKTSFTKSRENMTIILNKEAPSTLRMPISFVRNLITKLDKPSSPRQATTMAKDANSANTLPSLFV